MQAEKTKSESLLYNVLPESVAERLKRGDENIAEVIEDATVIVADLVGFTEMSTTLGPSALVQILNSIFRAFDKLARRFNLEKIKTMGDAYMVVGGIEPNVADHEVRSLQFAIAALDYIDEFNADNPTQLKLKVGMHAGPVVAGVIGETRYTFDLWGETVNLASRMESLGVPGLVQVAESLYQRLRLFHEFEARGAIEVKGKGKMETYLGRKPRSPTALSGDAQAD